jgi:hypothetical protein
MFFFFLSKSEYNFNIRRINHKLSNFGRRFLVKNFNDLKILKIARFSLVFRLNYVEIIHDMTNNLLLRLKRSIHY